MATRKFFKKEFQKISREREEMAILQTQAVNVRCFSDDFRNEGFSFQSIFYSADGLFNIFFFNILWCRRAFGYFKNIS